MLLYVQEEGEVRKSRVIKALEMEFAFVDKCKELIISAPAGCAAKNNGSSTVHTAFEVNTCRGRNYVAKINPKWSQQSFLIVDKVNMINFRLHTSIDKQL